jgi:hypothetical protein
VVVAFDAIAIGLTPNTNTHQWSVSFAPKMHHNVACEYNAATVNWCTLFDWPVCVLTLNQCEQAEA